MLFKGPKPNDIRNWVCVLEASTNYQVEMAKNYLSNLQIPSNILSKRDSAYSLNVGDMALVYLYVPEEFEEEAKQALTEWTASDREDESEDKED